MFVAGYYVCCRFGGIDKTDTYHPFGSNFIIQLWPFEGEAIDKYEPRKRRRFELTIEPIQSLLAKGV